MKFIIAFLVLAMSANAQDTITINGDRFVKTSGDYVTSDSAKFKFLVTHPKVNDKVPCIEYQYRWLWFTFTKKSAYVERVRDKVTGVCAYFLNDKGNKINRLIQYRNYRGWVTVD